MPSAALQPLSTLPAPRVALSHLECCEPPVPVPPATAEDFETILPESLWRVNGNLGIPPCRCGLRLPHGWRGSTFAHRPEPVEGLRATTFLSPLRGFSRTFCSIERKALDIWLRAHHFRRGRLRPQIVLGESFLQELKGCFHVVG